MEVRVKDLMKLMDAWAPPMLAESWDHPGLQVGDPEHIVRSVLVSLDLTREAVRYAKAQGIGMVISHHPFLFRPLKTLDLQTEKGQIIADLITGQISAFAAHTNLDTADGGVNDALADVLELENRKGLVKIHENKQYKLVVYVPLSHADAVRKALADAGAGAVGAYDRCAFVSEGKGHFHCREEAHPYIGTAGEEEAAEEVRIETFLSENDIAPVTAALRRAHPYEEPVYDLYELKEGSHWDTMGRIGDLPRAMTEREVLAYIKEKLGLPIVKYAGHAAEREIRTVAVLGGAGVEFAKDAKAAGADLYLTGDVKYHEAQDAAAMGLLLVDGGHFYTERVIIPVIARRIRKAAEENDWDISVLEDPTSADIFKYE